MTDRVTANLRSIAALIRAANKHITPDLWSKDPWKDWAPNNANKCLEKAEELVQRTMRRKR